MDKEFEGKRIGVPLVMTAEEVFSLRDADQAYEVTQAYAKSAQHSLLEAIEQVRPELFKLVNRFTGEPHQPDHIKI